MTHVTFAVNLWRVILHFVEFLVLYHATTILKPKISTSFIINNCIFVRETNYNTLLIFIHQTILIMKKTLLLLCALLGSLGAWAETISLGNSSSFKNNANTTFYKNDVVQTAGVWCDKATNGYVILTGSLSSYDGKIEVLKNGTPSLTISVPSVMTITGYSLGLTINQQNGTNSCTANNGGSDITLNGSSATTVSASGLSTNSVTINFTGTGDNNGECRLEFSDFTIDVSGTFVSDASQLSNTKVYTVTTARGTWTLNTGNTLLSSTHISKAAIITFTA